MLFPVKKILGELLYHSQLLPQNTRKSSNIPQLQATRRSTLAENRLTYYQMTAIFKRLLVSSSFETSYSHGYQVRRIIRKVLQWQNLNCQRLSWPILVCQSPTDAASKVLLKLFPSIDLRTAGINVFDFLASFIAVKAASEHFILATQHLFFLF